MTSDPIDWTQEAELDSDKEYRALLRSVRWTDGFGLLFVQCSPAEGSRLIAKVREDLLSKKIEVLTLIESIDNLYDLVDALPNKDQIDALFIQGIEHSLYEYEKTQLWDEPNERINYSEKGVPRLLGHLNLARERFRDNFKICFIFLVPKFALKYLIRRAPDFFDWRSGVLEFAMDAERLQQELQQIYLAQGEYSSFTPQRCRTEILKIQALLEEPEPTLEQKHALYFGQAVLHLVAEEDETAITSLDRALAINPDDYEGWDYRGVLLSCLKRYEEAIISFDRALAINPDDYVGWGYRGFALVKLKHYEEAVICFDRVLAINSDDYEVWDYRGLLLFGLERYKEAIISLDCALAINPDYYAGWKNRGLMLSALELYEEAIASYERAISINLNDHVVWYNKARCYVLQNQAELAIANLRQAIALNPKYREMAKTDSDFDSIRNDDRFQALIKGDEPRNE